MNFRGDNFLGIGRPLFADLLKTANFQTFFRGELADDISRPGVADLKNGFVVIQIEINVRADVWNLRPIAQLSDLLNPCGISRTLRADLFRRNAEDCCT